MKTWVEVFLWLWLSIKFAKVHHLWCGEPATALGSREVCTLGYRPSIASVCDISCGETKSFARRPRYRHTTSTEQLNQRASRHLA